MSAFGGKADMIQEKPDIKKCPVVEKKGCAEHARSLLGGLMGPSSHNQYSDTANADPAS